eukprot:Tamp_13966.p1 GENE.Tamp_13966~~Tamp_13966.p1  ORF type:complete len:389 (-),score=70.77 Tamp_13966:504-1499(-)
MDRRDRNVAFQLEQRRLKLATAASPEHMQDTRWHRMLSELQAADNRLASLAGADGDSQLPVGWQEHTEVVRNNYRTSTGGQSPKGVGTARIGDPVLNKHDKSIYERRCEQDGNCITSDWRTLSNEWQHDDNHRMRQRFWRHTKQVDRSMDISADEDMKAQLDKIISDTEKTIDECRQQFAIVSDEAVVHCEHRAVRHTCYIFESQSQLCDAASASRHNHFDGTVYFARSGLPKACQSQQRKHLMRLCRSAEKVPGVAVSHWPWQGHSFNLNKRGFSGDSFLGPYGFSGRTDYWPHTRDVPNNKFRDKSLAYMVGGGGHAWGDDVVGGMGGG